MGDPIATVLVPTHEHGPLLTVAVGSALRQSVESIEVFIVCDGATEDTLNAAEALREADDRVRLFVHDKGPRHGEIYRHQALQEAAGTIVCYLSDDDLWLPNHVANMAALLESADFAHAHPIGFRSGDRLYSWPGHLSLAETRRSMFEGRNFIPLSCGAHTLELYRRLPYGWRTTPPDIYTDLYMWQQLLSVEDVRVASGNHPSVLHFPSRLRQHMTMGERVEELERWAEAMVAPDFVLDLDGQIHDFLMVEWALSDSQVRSLDQQLRDATGRVANLGPISRRPGTIFAGLLPSARRCSSTSRERRKTSPLPRPDCRKPRSVRRLRQLASKVSRRVPVDSRISWTRSLTAAPGVPALRC